MNVDAEHNHKLKVSKMDIETCGGKTVNKTRETLYKEELDIIITYGSFLSTHNIC